MIIAEVLQAIGGAAIVLWGWRVYQLLIEIRDGLDCLAADGDDDDDPDDGEREEVPEEEEEEADVTPIKPRLAA